MIKIVLGVLVVLMALSCVTLVPQRCACALNHCVDLEIVDTPQALRQGLMGRDHLPKRSGMLFVFPDDDERRFWMKNMKFPLDLLWISKAGEIVDVSENVPVCAQDDCPTVMSGAPVRYVLEINAGSARAWGWTKGTVLKFHGMALADGKDVKEHAPGIAP